MDARYHDLLGLCFIHYMFVCSFVRLFKLQISFRILIVHTPIILYMMYLHQKSETELPYSAGNRIRSLFCSTIFNITLHIYCSVGNEYSGNDSAIRLYFSLLFLCKLQRNDACVRVVFFTV